MRLSDTHTLEYWKRQEAEAEAVCEANGWGRLPEWDTHEFQIAYDELYEARRAIEALEAEAAEVAA